MTSHSLSKEDRFMLYVDKEPMSGCWLWTGAINWKGYGQFQWGLKDTRKAHRVSYSLYNSPITTEDIIMHLCDNPSCVNPSHLKKGTHKENIQDAVKKGRHMGYKNGFKSGNTYGCKKNQC